jgi:5-methylcytosine-specific restriction endonuclease McrA
MYSLTHLTDAVLLQHLTALVAKDRFNSAVLLAYIAEADARHLYAPAGYSSMHAFCVEHLRYSDDAAFKRIRAARAARRFPALFRALADGRLHLAAVSLLASHLTHENVDTLIDAATHKRKIEIEEWLAERFLLPEGPRNSLVQVRVIPPQRPPETDDDLPLLSTGEEDIRTRKPQEESAIPQLALGPVPDTQMPAAPRFHFQFVVPKATHDKLRHAQSLLSHAVPTGDLAQVFDRALDALISKLEVRKLGVSTRDLRRREECVQTPGEGAISDGASRYIPAAVRRAAWERDKGRCTFVSITGGRCRSRQFLEFDHVEPFSRGGKATVDNIRLRCRMHNQQEAERAFGRDFMRQKREERVAASEDRDAMGPE